MTKRIFLGALLALAVGACGDDDGTTPGVDAGGVDGGGEEVDSGTPDVDAGPMLDQPSLQLGDGADPTDPTGVGIDPASAEPADYACFGMRTEPTSDGAPTEFTLQVREFRTDEVIEGLCVRFYDDNAPVVGDTCDPESDLVTDVMGNVTVTAPAGGWYAYRVFPKMGPSPALTIDGSVQINEAAPTSSSSVEGNSISAATLNLIPTVLGFRRAAGTAIVAGTVFDCNEDPVYGATIRVYREDGTLIAEGSANNDPHYRYFDGDDFPSAEQPWSHTDGLFAVANIPVGADGEFVFVEAWGKRADGELEVVSCERMPVFGSTISIINMQPLRSDAPACPGLSD
ncbi:MAG: hypothetical protein H6721_20970 [Sandaracinus sp.]|nr:hypothetical protein [Sandaracinus sp.]MCB9634605.1 hypothetical protein [Sandaracinus sp.]